MRAAPKKCHIPDCGQTIRREYLMCAFHWAKVPLPIQREVYRTCKLWQDSGGVEPYRTAVIQATNAVCTGVPA